MYIKYETSVIIIYTEHKIKKIVSERLAINKINNYRNTGFYITWKKNVISWKSTEKKAQLLLIPWKCNRNSFHSTKLGSRQNTLWDFCLWSYLNSHVYWRNPQFLPSRKNHRTTGSSRHFSWCVVFLPYQT